MSERLDDDDDDDALYMITDSLCQEKTINLL